jgi:methionine-rich copper-binding protein CopC
VTGHGADRQVIAGTVRLVRGALIRGVLFGMVINAFVVGVAAAPATAHTTLESSSPADGARLSSAPDQVTLDFTEPIRTALTRVLVRGPNGGEFESGPPQVIASDRMAQPLQPLGAAGGYQISFRVVSVDGHPLAGTIRFTLTRPGPGTVGTSPGASAPGSAASPGTEPATNAAANPGVGDDGISPWVIVIATVAVVVFITGVVWFSRRVTRDLD